MTTINSYRSHLPQDRVNDDIEFYSTRSPESILYKSYPSNNFSNSTAVWSGITPPNGERSSLNKFVMLRFGFNVQMTATNATTNLLYQPSCMTLKQFPVERITTNEVIGVNSFSNSLQISDVIDQLSFYGTDYFNLSDAIGADGYPDKFVDYNDEVLSTHSVFANPFDNILNTANSGCHQVYVVSNTPTAAELNIVVYTSIFTDPFLTSKNDAMQQKGLCKLTQGGLSVTRNFANNLNHMFRIAETTMTGLGITSPVMTVNITSAELIAQWHILDNTVEIPQTVYYRYNKYEVFSTAVGTLTSGQVITQPLSSIDVKRHPQYMLFGARVTNTVRGNSGIIPGTSVPIYFFPVTNVSISYDTEDNKLANATPKQLFDICAENGQKQLPWDLSSMEGSLYTNYIVNGATASRAIVTSIPICVDVSKNISIQGYVGQPVITQLQPSLTLYNHTSASQSVIVYTILVTPGVFYISDEQTNYTLDLIPMNADIVPFKNHDVPMDFLIGGSLLGGRIGLSTFKKFAKKIGRNVKKGVKFLEKAEPVLHRVVDVGSEFGVPGTELLKTGLDTYDVAKEILKKPKKAGGRVLTSRDRRVLLNRAYLN